MALQLHATLGKRATTAVTATATVTDTATVECYANWGVVAKFVALSGRTVGWLGVRWGQGGDDVAATNLC